MEPPRTFFDDCAINSKWANTLYLISVTLQKVILTLILKDLLYKTASFDKLCMLVLLNLYYVLYNNMKLL